MFGVSRILNINGGNIGQLCSLVDLVPKIGIPNSVYDSLFGLSKFFSFFKAWVFLSLS